MKISRALFAAARDEAANLGAEIRREGIARKHGFVIIGYLGDWRKVIIPGTPRSDYGTVAKQTRSRVRRAVINIENQHT